jgi:hypothetical protein
LLGGISYWNASEPAYLLRDLWRSLDLGSTWTLLSASAPFGVRQGATSALVNGAVLVIGGDTLVAGAVGDVWSSANLGTTWSSLTAGGATPFSARAYHTSTVDITTNTLLVIGGRSTMSATARNGGVMIVYNDVYSSVDSGVTWTVANAKARFAPRYGATSFWMNGIVFIVGGVNMVAGVVTPTNDMSVTDGGAAG